MLPCHLVLMTASNDDPEVGEMLGQVQLGLRADVGLERRRS